MATLHVRNVPEALYEALRARAQVRGRSIANEAIAVLAETVAPGFVPGAPGLHSGTVTRPLAPRERLGEPAGRALAAASSEAHTLGHDLVETEHVLLALLENDSVVAVLDHVGVSPEDVRKAIRRRVKRGRKTEPGPRMFGAGAKRVLEHALRESLSSGG